MDTLENELRDLKSFIADLKADRQAQKDKEQRESWTKYTSLSIVFIAVLAAVATQWAGKYSSRTLVKLNEATLHQAKASDSWSYYQAKSIKLNLYELSREQLQRASSAPNGTTPTGLAALDERIKRYGSEKDKILTDAKALEQQRDAARRAADTASEHGSGMGMAVSLYQISIAMGSICLVVKKKPLWYWALALAALATVEMVQVWLL